jgi:hypothetical protein
VSQEAEHYVALLYTYRTVYTPPPPHSPSLRLKDKMSRRRNRYHHQPAVYNNNNNNNNNLHIYNQPYYDWTLFVCSTCLKDLELQTIISHTSDETTSTSTSTSTNTIPALAVPVQKQKQRNKKNKKQRQQRQHVTSDKKYCFYRTIRVYNDDVKTSEKNSNSNTKNKDISSTLRTFSNIYYLEVGWKTFTNYVYSSTNIGWDPFQLWLLNNRYNWFIICQSIMRNWDEVIKRNYVSATSIKNSNNNNGENNNGDDSQNGGIKIWKYGKNAHIQHYKLVHICDVLVLWLYHGYFDSLPIANNQNGTIPKGMSYYYNDLFIPPSVLKNNNRYDPTKQMQIPEMDLFDSFKHDPNMYSTVISFVRINFDFLWETYSYRGGTALPVMLETPKPIPSSVDNETTSSSTDGSKEAYSSSAYRISSSKEFRSIQNNRAANIAAVSQQMRKQEEEEEMQRQRLAMQYINSNNNNNNIAVSNIIISNGDNDDGEEDDDDSGWEGEEASSMTRKMKMTANPPAGPGRPDDENDAYQYLKNKQHQEYYQQQPSSSPYGVINNTNNGEDDNDGGWED